MRIAFKVFVGLELVRLILWVLLLIWVGLLRDPNEALGSEAQLEVVLAVGAVGFPYSWIASSFAGTWNIFGLSGDVALSVVLSNFSIWIAATICMAFLFKKGRKAQCLE